MSLDERMLQEEVYITGRSGMYLVKRVNVIGYEPTLRRTVLVENCVTMAITEFHEGQLEKDFKFLRAAGVSP